MPNVFLISDTHFGHANICKFQGHAGQKLRPWDDVAEMDEAMIANWNAAVGPKDKVYHLGDVVIARRKLAEIMPRLNGDKVLIKGNHDIFKLSDYTAHFRDIRAYHKLDRALLSHVPMHPDSVTRFKGNIHGHLHDGVVRRETEVSLEEQYERDPRYLSVCVEHWNYTPVELSVALEKLGK